MIRRGQLRAGEKVQFTDRKGKMVTIQLTPGGRTQTEHGFILHDDVIGRDEGTVIVTASGPEPTMSAAEAHAANSRKPWKGTRAIGGWEYCVMRPRLTDYVLSMPRGAQIMYPKDIAEVIQLGDIRPGMHVLESGGGSGAMGINLLEAVGETGSLTTIELRPEFAHICEANATVFYGRRPEWWDLRVGDFDSVAATLDGHSFDRIVLDMLDPWNRIEQAHRVIRPGGVLVAYITTTTQLSRMAEAVRESGQWTEPQMQETIERTWKAQGLAVRPNHQMIGHTGFLLVTRAMADGVAALRKKQRATKDVYTDVDDMEDLELRDISDRKVRKVIRDLDDQVSHLADTDGAPSSDRYDRGNGLAPKGPANRTPGRAGRAGTVAQPDGEGDIR
ncbi:MAG: tRNA (adenine-N1)-methyltransferase [Bifidobacteriaceae bacterium]|nr:tRNA (adenine-N1)-methyltransferase [Bifidobacteriaceae bacterium]